MANKFQRFLGDMAVGFLNPKGNMADYQHAARLYVDDTFRLAPKHKFLYYVVFNINPDALQSVGFQDRHKLELNYLVKQADLPRYSFKTENLNQYNRKTTAYTAIQYEPVSLTLHDDNNGITNMLWALYYGYYIADRTNSANPDTDTYPTAYVRNAYFQKSMMPYRYGLDNDSDEPFFDSIQLFTLSRQRFFSYMLCNPKLTKWDHDNVDQSDGRGILENKMTIAYDAVIYNSGVVQEDEPAGFAVLHYDKMPSPIDNGNNIAGIFGDIFSINALNSSAGGLLGGLVGGLINGLAGGVSSYTNTGNQIPYGYGQPTFLNQGIGLRSAGGLQQYGFGGVSPLASLTVAGIGLAAKGLGNVISGVGSLFSNSNGSTTPGDQSKTVEAPNGEAPAAKDVTPAADDSLSKTPLSADAKAAAATANKSYFNDDGTIAEPLNDNSNAASQTSAADFANIDRVDSQTNVGQAPATITQPTYDAMGNVTGSETVPAPPSAGETPEPPQQNYDVNEVIANSNEELRSAPDETQAMIANNPGGTGDAANDVGSPFG
jgi:hypothetical protein